MTVALNPAIRGIPMPRAIRALPIDPRGFPVPWFVATVDGKPEFRMADSRKFDLAVVSGLCWVCGEKLNNRVTFVIGPMCAVNRTTAEPGCHLECAEYSVKACPFLSRPHMDRREGGMPEGDIAGEMIRRNPGVTCLWTAKSPGAGLVRDFGTGILFNLFEPTAVSWWAEGRAASRAEVLASVDSGLPILMEMAEAEGPHAVIHLLRLYDEAEPYWPRA